MFDSPLRHTPLTSAAKALRDEILAIPRTDEPMMDDVPEDFDVDLLERLHVIAVSGSAAAISELRKLSARYPQFPKLLNYLHVAHVTRNEHRQADAVVKKLAAKHPDYLFTRIALTNLALEKNQLERAIAALHPSLKLRELYPDRKLFHESEIKNFYLCVGRILARRGEQELARGVGAALATILDDEAFSLIIDQEVMKVNLLTARRRIEEDNERRITVRPAPLPTKLVTNERPSFHHVGIDDLYEFGPELPGQWIEATLALPRETLVQDLIAVLDDCITRTPNFMRGIVEEDESFAVYHALHLLAEIHGHEACSSLLRLLALHPHAVEFWLEERKDYSPLLARIIAGDLPACLAWLRQPGIDYRSKGMVTAAMEQIAKIDPARLLEISATLGETLAFHLDSPPQDNILDTGCLLFLIRSLVELRTSEHLPLIRKAYDMDLVEIFSLGTFEDLSEDISKPIDPPEPWLPIARQYKDQTSEAAYDDDGEFFDDGRGDYYEDHPMYLPPAAPVIGRNDPCPCGSGRKYKKCCQR